MARVNLEDKFFSGRGLFRLMQLMNWDRQKAVGALALLWHRTQTDQKIDCSAMEICEAAWFDGQDTDHFIDVLVSCRFIEPVDSDSDDLYRIKGNQEQIAWRQSHIERSMKGGEATKKRWSEFKQKQAEEGQVACHELGQELGHMPERSQGQFNTIQSNANQFNPRQVNSEDKEIRKYSSPPPGDPPDGGAPNKPKFSDQDLIIAGDWLLYAQEVMPWQKSWTTEKFAEGIARVRKSLDLNQDGLLAVLKFVREDEFWRDKACSPGALMNRSDRNGQRKIDNILVKMKSNMKKSPQGKMQSMLDWANEEA